MSQLIPSPISTSVFVFPLLHLVAATHVGGLGQGVLYVLVRAAVCRVLECSKSIQRCPLFIVNPCVCGCAKTPHDPCTPRTRVQPAVRPIRARGCRAPCAWGGRSLTAHSTFEASRRSTRADECRRVTVTLSENVGILSTLNT